MYRFVSPKEFWINNRINYFEIKSLATKTTSIKQNGSTVFWQFTEDSNGTIFGVADGINFPSGGVFKVSNGYENYSEKFNIDSKSLWSIFYDNQFNKLYVGSLDKGLFVVDLNTTILFYTTPEIVDIVKDDKKTYLLLLCFNLDSFIIISIY